MKGELKQWQVLKHGCYILSFYLFKGDENVEKDIIERLKEIMGEEAEKGLTIIFEGTPVINIYLGSEE